MSLKYKKSQICLVVALFFFSFFAAAQDTEIEEIKKFITKKRVNAAYLLFGGNNMELNSIDQYLEMRDHPTTEAAHFAWGLGGHVIHNKFVLGVEIIRLTERKGNNGSDFNTYISAKYSTLNLGYLALSKKGLMCWPFLGLGFGQLKLKLMENNIDSFKDFTGFQKGSESRRNSFLFNAGIALDYFHKYNNRKKGKNSIVIGLRAGYIGSIGNLNWKINGVAVDDGPDSGIKGPYIRVIFGLGGYIEKLIKQAI
jgi:hypothetical protein